MTHDHSSDDTENTADVHDDHADHDTGDHGADAHGHGHDDSAPEASTLVPTTGRQLIFPALILIIVGILLIGPVTGAFAPKPGSAGTNTSILPTSTPAPPTVAPTKAPVLTPGAGGTPSGGATPGAGGTPGASGTPGGGNTPATPVSSLPSQTAPPTKAIAESPPTLAAATATSGPSAGELATRTAVALAGQQGIVTRAPVELDFAGAKFMVQAGSDLLPDWQPSAADGQAVWITGTYANHVIYLPFSDTNSALFNATKVGDLVNLVMDSGQTFQFTVTRAERAYNGPPATAGQFTTTTAMNQDHAGVTIFLVGDPSSDRSVVQADFNGNIQ